MSIFNLMSGLPGWMWIIASVCASVMVMLWVALEE